MVHLDAVSDRVTFYIMRNLIDQLSFWQVLKRRTRTILKIYNYKPFASDKNLDNLSFAQLIILYAQLLEKDLKEEHLEQVKELLE